jgi:hypothetical protein
VRSSRVESLGDFTMPKQQNVVLYEWREQMVWRKRLAMMRIFNRFLITCLVFFITGCTTPEDGSRLESAVDMVPGSYQPGSQVTTKVDAITVAGQLFEETGTKWTQSPAAVLTEELSYAEAVRWIGVAEGEYDLWPHETRVWFVIFKGRWQLIPLGATQVSPSPPEYEGCIFSLFTTRDGELISMGDSICP